MILRLPDAAVRLGVSLSTVRRLIDARRLTVVRLSARRRGIEEAELAFPHDANLPCPEPRTGAGFIGEDRKMSESFGWQTADTRAMKEIRVAWRIADKSGRGLWHTAWNHMERIEREVADLNKQFGPGTHWIEEREA